MKEISYTLGSTIADGLIASSALKTWCSTTYANTKLTVQLGYDQRNIPTASANPTVIIGIPDVTYTRDEFSGSAVARIFISLTLSDSHKTRTTASTSDIIKYTGASNLETFANYVIQIIEALGNNANPALGGWIVTGADMQHMDIEQLPYIDAVLNVELNLQLDNDGEYI